MFFFSFGLGVSCELRHSGDIFLRFFGWG